MKSFILRIRMRLLAAETMLTAILLDRLSADYHQLIRKQKRIVRLQAPACPAPRQSENPLHRLLMKDLRSAGVGIYGDRYRNN